MAESHSVRGRHYDEWRRLGLRTLDNDTFQQVKNNIVDLSWMHVFFF